MFKTVLRLSAEKKKFSYVFYKKTCKKCWICHGNKEEIIKQKKSSQTANRGSKQWLKQLSKRGWLNINKTFLIVKMKLEKCIESFQTKGKIKKKNKKQEKITWKKTKDELSSKWSCFSIYILALRSQKTKKKKLTGSKIQRETNRHWA